MGHIHPLKEGHDDAWLRPSAADIRVLLLSQQLHSWLNKTYRKEDINTTTSFLTIVGTDNGIVKDARFLDLSDLSKKELDLLVVKDNQVIAMQKKGPQNYTDGDKKLKKDFNDYVGQFTKKSFGRSTHVGSGDKSMEISTI